MNDERQARTKAINDAVKKQLCYGLLGFCVLTGIVFAFIYPDLAKNDEATVSSGIILSMIIVAALGSPVLLVVALVRSSSRNHQAHIQKPETVISTQPASSSESKYWDGTFGDAFQWFMWGVCVPVAGLIGGLLNPEKAHPAVGMIVGASIGLAIITIRLRRGKWPEGG